MNTNDNSHSGHTETIANQLNLAQQPQCEEWSDQTIQVHTIKDLGTPLYSLDAEYGEEGYDILKKLAEADRAITRGPHGKALLLEIQLGGRSAGLK